MHHRPICTPRGTAEHDKQAELYIHRCALISAFICTNFQVKPINISCTALEYVSTRYLGNGQTGPRFPLDPSGFRLRTNAYRPLSKHPPPRAHARAIGSDEVPRGRGKVMRGRVAVFLGEPEIIGLYRLILTVILPLCNY